MESLGEWERKNLINELLHGMELARQLQVHLSSTSPSPASSHETRQLLAMRIVASYEKVLSMVNGSSSSIVEQPLGGGAAAIRMSESPPSLGGSPPHSGDSDRDQELTGDASRKRKAPRWSKRVRVSPGMGLEGPLDDGYSWRKYGQKDILGAKYPRGYYRCTHRSLQGCLATKQVQRSDVDPTIFEITYRGRHTCNQPPPHGINPQLPTPETQEPPRVLALDPQQTNELPVKSSPQQQQQQQQTEVFKFLRDHRVMTEEMDSQNQPFSPPFNFTSQLSHSPSQNEIRSSGLLESVTGTFSPPFMPSVAPGSNSFLMPLGSIFPGSDDQGDSHKSDPNHLPGIVSSAATSGTTSRMVRLDTGFGSNIFDDQSISPTNPGSFN